MEYLKSFLLVILLLIYNQNTFALDENTAAIVESAKKALAAQDHDEGDVEISILELQRSSGNTLTLRWQYQNKSNEVKTVLKGDPGEGTYGLARNVYIIDPQNKKKYMVVEDEKREPIAAKLGSYGKVEVEAGKTLKTWAKFPAPPIGVEKISIYIPGAPPFEDISIKG